MALNDFQRETIEMVRQNFRVAYNYTLPFHTEAQRIQDAYTATINRDVWGTLSEIPFPTVFLAVEQALPFLMEGMFGNPGMVELIPKNTGQFQGESPDRAVRLAERFIMHQLNTIMQVKKNSLKTMRDMLRFGVGYAMIEVNAVTPNIAKKRSARVLDRTISRVTIETSDQVEDQLSLRYFPYSQVFPLPGGSNPHESDHYVVDFLTVSQLNDLFEQDRQRPADERVFMGSPSEIIEMAKSQNLDANLMPPAALMARLAGLLKHPHDARREGDNKKVEPLIPVAKFYTKHRHVWVALNSDRGGAIIYDQSNKAHTLRSDLLMAQSNPDGQQWFSTSPVGVSMGLHNGVNMFNNALLDMIQLHLAPPMFIDRNVVNDSRSDEALHVPYSVIDTNGDPSRAVFYPQGPQIPQGALQMGETIRDTLAQVLGQPQQLQGTGGAGLVRGGINAMESLFQNVDARQKLMLAIQETGYVTDLVERTMLISQVIIPKSGISFVTKNQARNAETTFEQVTIQPEDLRHTWDFKLNLQARGRNAAGDASINMAKADRLLQNENYSAQKVLEEYVVGDPDLNDRLLATEEEKQANIQRIQAQQQPAQPGIDQTGGGANLA